ncbi:MAG: hypothetical protein ABIR96_03820 [Bdellovibrionota bacterium]
MISKHLESIAQKLGLNRGDESVFGETNGQAVQISYEKKGRSRFYYVRMLAKGLDPSFFEGHETWLASTAIKARQLKTEEAPAGSQHRTLLWGPLSFPFKDTSAQKIPPGLEVLSARIKERLGSSSRVCSYCSSSSGENMLLNNRVTVMCSSCLSRKETEHRSASKTFDEMRPNYLSGAFAGFFGSLIGAGIWLAAIGFTQKDHLMLSLLAGFLCGWLYRKASLKVDLVGKMLIIVLTLAGFFFAQVLQIFYAIHQHHQVWDFAGALRASLDSFSGLSSFEKVRGYLFPIIGAVYAGFFLFPKDSLLFKIERGTSA